ncbi:hypothetical protein M0813_30239 [Anaeramoeba flamelloides]|uniref:Uncharacterized protein n=1 Tax=Anaeramoeba flamelloides TaxID=1746091 RepID=A0ABQ8XMZ9_9EUKA|nr:hypothetical protein M0813_30239 [Anaeramoeba flamelloides]
MKIILFIVLILFVYCQEFEINETFETVEENEYQFFTRLANKSDVTTMIEEKKSFVLCLFAKFSEKSLEFSKRYDLVANSLKDCVEYEFFRFEYQKEDNDLIKNMEFPNINAILTIKNGQPNEVFSGEAEVFKISIKSKFLGPITFIKSVRGFEAIESQAEKLIKTIVINSKKKEEDKTSISSIKTAIESKELTDTDQKKKIYLYKCKDNSSY